MRAVDVERRRAVEPADEMQAFAPKLAGSTYWSTVTSEYGVGGISYGGSIELTGETPPAMNADTDVQKYVGDAIQSGKFGVPDPQAIYTLFYPQGTVITQTNPLSNVLGTIQSCVAYLLTEVLSHEWVEAWTAIRSSRRTASSP